MGNFLNLIKLYEENLTTNTIVNDENRNVFPLISGPRQEHVFSLLVFNIILEILASAVGQEKEITGIQMGRSKTVSNCR